MRFGFLPFASRSPTVTLTVDQIRSFREKGFLTLDAITTPDEIAMLRVVFERLVRAKAGFEEGAQFDLVGADECAVAPKLLQIMNPIFYAPELRDTLFRANALSIAKQLLGKDASPFFEHAILKPAYIGHATPWHQDEAYRVDPGYEYRQLGFWMPLLNATPENGCMHYIAGTHRGEVLPHRSPNDDPKVHALECFSGFDPALAVACPLPAGGCTIHDGRTLHYAGPNKSHNQRWAYILDFDLPPRRSIERREFPWHDGKRSADLARKKKWLRRGGLAVLFWRILRNGLPKNRLRLSYLTRRAWRSIHDS